MYYQVLSRSNSQTHQFRQKMDAAEDMGRPPVQNKKFSYNPIDLQWYKTMALQELVIYLNFIKVTL